MSLSNPNKNLQKLQKALHAKAKSQPNFRFYSLWDKISRADVLHAAWLQCRANGGAHGVDGETFEQIATKGTEIWLGKLAKELREGSFHAQPLRRVMIPKSNGGQRPLSIPTIKDRVVQTAVVMILAPIFEADLHTGQYGFRPGLDAKMAVRRVYWHITKSRRTEVVDADLKDYFTSIPHGQLLRCVSRRIADGTLLKLIRQWLKAPVVEQVGRRISMTNPAKATCRGTAQGGVISPLLANLYFRRFMIAWEKFGYSKKLDAHIVNYADDFVICCKPGKAQEALAAAERIMTKIGLNINHAKTRLAFPMHEEFDFLGYSIGLQYGNGGRSFIGTRPSHKAICKIMKKIHFETSRRWLETPIEKRILELNSIIRGWGNYFNQGPVLKSYSVIQRYTEQRVIRWLAKKHKKKGKGYGTFKREDLYERYGLYKLPIRKADLTKVKA